MVEFYIRLNCINCTDKYNIPIFVSAIFFFNRFFIVCYITSHVVIIYLSIYI